jgi:hypothetical protein
MPGIRLQDSRTAECEANGCGRLLIARNGAQGEIMLWTIFAILLILWLLGLVTSYTLGGFIHILLVIALVVVVIELVGRRRVL